MVGDVVLIGGQALNFWAERYRTVAELASAAPFTSEDIDFCGQSADVQRCAELLGASHELYGPNDRSVCTGLVTTPDGVNLDFVHTPRGVRADEVQRKAISFEQIRVMHPIHVLMSRAANVVQIPRDTPHALKQLRASVVVVREFIREVLARGKTRGALKLNEAAFAVTISSDGLAVWKNHAIDVFAAVVLEPLLGEKFIQIRYPQMQKRVDALRS